MTKNAHKQWQVTSIFLLVLSSSVVFADSKLYRYVDENGVKVIAHSLPAEYAQKGYEVLNSKGQVLEIVTPAPTETEIAQESAKRVLRAKYEVLRRRYSSLDEIERAKLRRLENINTNISILRGNIGSINVRIENLMSKAAEMEREGKTVSSQLLQQLTDARAELTVAESALNTRLEEYQAVSERFDSDVATFVKGSELADTDNQLN